MTDFSSKAIIAAFAGDLNERYKNLRIEQNSHPGRKKGIAHLNLFVAVGSVAEKFSRLPPSRPPKPTIPATWKHILNISISGMTVTAEPGYYMSSTPKIKQISFDLTDPDTFVKLYDFIEACGGRI
jgi:hypothetical protein